MDAHRVLAGLGVAGYCAAFYVFIRWMVSSDARLRRSALHPVRHFARQVRERLTGRVVEEEDYVRRFTATLRWTVNWVMTPLLAVIVVIALVAAISGILAG